MTPDFIIEKNVERTMRRGRRPIRSGGSASTGGLPDLAITDDDITRCSICDDLLTIPVPKSDRRPDDMWFCRPCASAKRWLEKNLDELGKVSDESLRHWMKKHPDMGQRLKKVVKFVHDTKRW